MFALLVTVLLIPVLLPQGLYVRMTTPKLPEAKGARSGKDGEGQALKVLIIGDSAAAGVGVEHQSEALSGQLINCLKEHFEVDWLLEAETGHTTEDLIKRLDTIPHSDFDLIVTSVGVNDVTSSVTAEEWAQLQLRLFDEMLTRFSAGRILITPVPPMHLFPALPQPLKWCLGNRAKELNAKLEQLTQRLPQCEIVAPKFVLDGNLMAKDGFHPGPKLYQQWAETVSEHYLSKD